MPKFEYIENKNLIENAKRYPNRGQLFQKNDSGYAYIKLDDSLIYELFPLIEDEKKEIPNYFSGKEAIGAHITTLYSDEIFPIPTLKELGSFYTFEIDQVFRAHFPEKTYLGITVQSKELDLFRSTYGLSNRLSFRGVSVPFHFTVAVIPSPTPKKILEIE